jgi:hypothetical protein
LGLLDEAAMAVWVLNMIFVVALFQEEPAARTRGSSDRVPLLL